MSTLAIANNPAMATTLTNKSNRNSALWTKIAIGIAALAIALTASLALGTQEAHAATYKVQTKKFLTTYVVSQDPSFTQEYGFRNGHYGPINSYFTYGVFHVRVDKGPWTKVTGPNMKIPVFFKGKHTIQVEAWSDVHSGHNKSRTCCNRHYITAPRKI